MDVVKNLERQTLTEANLESMLKGIRVLILPYENLDLFPTLQSLFDRAPNVILLMRIQGPNEPEVGHWVTLLNYGSYVEHFDSYGLLADQELAITHEKPLLSEMLVKSHKPVVQNTTQLQAVKSMANTCGRWAVSRIRMRNLKLSDYVNFIHHAHSVPDVVVSLQTMFLG